METRICHRHEIKVEIHGECPLCVQELVSPRRVEDMTVTERLAEFDSWGGVLEIGISRLTPRLEQLIGRAVYTHEYAISNWENLRIEIRHSGEKQPPGS